MTATKRKPKPITAHPMFPVVTSLWFAAFFGLGSFAVAPSLLEGPVVALGIPAIVPAAAPPLGFTARVLLALGLLLLGAIIGFVAGRKLAPREAAPVRRRDMSAARRQRSDEAADRSDEPRRVLNPAEDLGEPLDAPAEDLVAPLRRRALSLADEGQPQVPAEDAPLPGYLPWENASPAYPPVARDEDPLALEGLLEAAAGAAEGSLGAGPFSAPADSDEEQFAAFAPPAAFTQEVEAPSVAARDVEHDSARPTEQIPAASVLAPKPLLQAPAAQVTPIERAPLDGLGMVQLVERLAVAIARHAPPVRDAAPLEASAYAAPVVPENPVPVETVAAPQPERVDEVRDDLRVVRLRPLAVELTPPLDEDDEQEGVAQLARFLRAPAASAPETSAPATDDPAEPEVAEERYPSLLDMGPASLRQHSSRIEDGLAREDEPAPADVEPTVVFPGQVSALQGGLRRFERPSILPVQGSPLAAPGQAAPSTPAEVLPDASPDAPGGLADPEEADRALRAALATLQRMTAQG